MESQEQIETLPYAPIRKSRFLRKAVIATLAAAIATTPFTYPPIAKIFRPALKTQVHEHIDFETPELKKSIIASRVYSAAYQASYDSIIETYRTRNYTIDPTSGMENILEPDEEFKKKAQAEATKFAKRYSDILSNKEFLEWAVK